jgi:hypothetical protein
VTFRLLTGSKRTRGSAVVLRGRERDEIDKHNQLVISTSYAYVGETRTRQISTIFLRTRGFFFHLRWLI